MREETESSVEEAARDLQTEQRKELEQMWEKQMLTLKLEEALEEEADQVCEIRLEMEQLLEEESQVRELQIALDVVESQQRQEAGAEAEAEAEAGSGAARSAEQKVAADGGSSPAAGAGVFSSSLEDEENRAGVVIYSLQKMEAQLEGAPTAAPVGL
ncbi:golgin subfamily A member 6-like protein 25 [Saccopteryx bilineata]|uniref:golgin subfamily A member 6-like protein 25 n=1 Tax=Saccopteryx bilineata TaxID=59482 RepID=UPI00338DC8D1